ncbi:MAG: MurR/RpiR family transcriptional regulator [Clostridia bacterium]|nr:MurR/RpiR family transcriptional regulator [Clostridia bacterium]
MKGLAENKNVLHLIQSRMSDFSKSQKKIAAYILERYDEAPFVTAAKLGQTVGVSESTVVRFASELGYGGYPEMQKAIGEAMRSQLTAAQRVSVTSGRVENGNVLDYVLASDMNNIRSSLEQIKRADFEKIVDAIVQAKNIYILGVRSSASLASFFGFYLNLISPNVRNVRAGTSSELFEEILRIDEGDVFIGISFPRYSKRTLKAIDYAKSRGATVISITDRPSSPIAVAADLCLTALSDMASFVDSLVAPLSVINALLVAISMKKQEDIVETLEQLEQIWDEYEVYEKFGTEGK